MLHVSLALYREVTKTRTPDLIDTIKGESLNYNMNSARKIFRICLPRACNIRYTSKHNRGSVYVSGSNKNDIRARTVTSSPDLSQTQGPWSTDSLLDLELHHAKSVEYSGKEEDNIGGGGNI